LQTAVVKFFSRMLLHPNGSVDKNLTDGIN